MAHTDFDPDKWAEENGNIFGLPYSTSDASMVVIPAPWDVTVSYRDGTIHGPEAILQASYQVDLLDPVCGMAWKKGLALDEIPEDWKSKAISLRKQAVAYLHDLTSGKELHPETIQKKEPVNAGCEAFHTYIYERAKHWLQQGKKVAMIGGDHSTPFGLMRALAEKHPGMGILQIDAHADLRHAFEGFTWSHASIMHNAITRIPEIGKLVQVGIRDYCKEETDMIAAMPDRIKTYFDLDLKQAEYTGKSKKEIFTPIVEALPQEVYISFDIDGLDPKLCQHTGTPVPGGFEFEEALFLIQMVFESGRKVIGFDINETSDPHFGKEDGDRFDAIVGARLLFRMANMMLHF